MFYEKRKKYIPIILLATIILTVYFQYFTPKSQAQGWGYPVIVQGVNPDAISWIRFWVSTTNMDGTASTTLSVKDDSTIAVKILKDATVTDTPIIEEKNFNSLELLAAMYKETIRHNLWYEGISYGGDVRYENTTQAGARNLIDSINATTTKWIKDGFNYSATSSTGNPAYVSDSVSFYERIEDQVINSMMSNDPVLESMPESIRREIKRVTGTKGDTDYPTISNIDNTEKEIVMDPENWSWNDWLDLNTSPEKSREGAWLMTQNELNKRIEEEQNSYKEEISQGKGSLSYKRCKVYKIDANGTRSLEREYKGDPVYDQKAEDTYKITPGPLKTFTTTECTIATPGNVVSEQLSSISTYQNKIAEATAALGNSKESVLNSMKLEISKLNDEKLKNGILGQIDTSSYEEKLKDIQATTTKSKVSADTFDSKNKNSWYNPLQSFWDSVVNSEWNNNDYYDPCSIDPDSDDCFWFDLFGYL